MRPRFQSILYKNGFILWLMLLTVCGFSQAQVVTKAEDKGRIVNIKAKRLVYDQSLGIDARRLIGDVQWETEGTVMRCDSAYMYNDKNVEAFSHISIVKGDSIFIYGDSLRYNAATKMANLKGNVRCIEKDMTLTTNYLTYDVGNSIASYYNGGTIVNKENTLKSKNGHYYSGTKELTFHYDVVLINPEYKMNSDTLRYNTVTKTSYFIGPSIITSKENYIYCENGWYDTDREVSRFSKNTVIVTKDQRLLGDSVFYDRKNKYGRATKNVRIIDTLHKSFIVGDFAEYFEKINKSIITGHAVYGRTIETDTLFLAADTLFFHKPDSAHSYVRAFRHVKMFKTDFQGMCDSLDYYIHDSMMHMYNSPILWTNNGQATAKQINVIAGQKSVKFFELNGNATVIQKADSLDENKYNQVYGKHMEGFFEKDSIRKLNVIGNAQIIYYVKKKTTFKGVNKTICTDLSVWFNSSGVDRATFRNKPESVIYPPAEVNDTEMRLKNFVWLENKRPRKKNDILIR